MLPVLAVVTLMNAGFDAVSNKLATLNTANHTIQIRDPATGQILKDISAPIQWPVNGVVILEFGESDLPYQPFHTGIDIANPDGKIGDPVRPFMEGR